ncbi:transcription factor HAC1 [Sugiyamaella lignohabitans]|uniref:Transcription factor HAC1 n=1 Tax=Sugiyamaella lignohabitans TaxID=796027 RepID=A0A167EU65_9ASCO|nr:transcription factor HAC1 [Sugiyamaella lignohabitans]ANB14459.1 transcription factor HAC1 [Sugiyamaella lignohabitans]
MVVVKSEPKDLYLFSDESLQYGDDTLIDDKDALNDDEDNMNETDELQDQDCSLSDRQMSEEHDLDDSDMVTTESIDAATGLTITTTVGSGANKRKEVMTLPLPPGSLPPRKRAKTKDEKEQRRIERIMRNRQAAHASREKKRKHVEELEKKCVVLTSENEQLQQNMRQMKESQVQMLEQHYLLMAKVQQLQNVLKTAKTTGDLSVLDSADFTVSLPSMPTATLLSQGSSDMVSPVSTSTTTTGTSTPGTSVDDSSERDKLHTKASRSSSPLSSSSSSSTMLLSSTVKEEECTSPEALLLSNVITTAPSLSNSPLQSDNLDFDDSSNESTISTPPSHNTYIKQELFEDDKDSYNFENSNQAHHPAAVMCDQQRLRLTKFSPLSESLPQSITV